MMKKFAALLLSILLSAMLPVVAMTAPPQVHASLSADTVLIGDRFSMEIIIEKDMMQAVSLPSFDRGLAENGIEILAESDLDTVRQDGRRQVLRKRYEMTSFDAGIYQLGRYPVLYADKNITDTLYSAESLPVVVKTLPVDTEKETIYDIKAPLKAPLLVSEFAGYLFAAIVTALVIAALILLVRREISKRRRNDGEAGVTQPSVPPHVQAIQDLETLYNQKLWQSGKAKAYYTRLTDILRSYLGGRYGLNAMEMTSDEIIQAVRPLNLPDKNSEDLRNIMLTADLVKFAKHVPEPEVNDNLYHAAYYFIEDTKQVAEETAEEEVKGENDEK